MAILEAQDIHISFGGVQALQGVDLSLGEREVLAVIGPNGAGKTTLINCISGWYKPDIGRILLGGRDITRLPADKVAAAGIGRTFQNTAIFRGLTVLENIMVGAHLWMRSNFLFCMLYWNLAQKEEVEVRRLAEDIIDFLEIQHIRRTPAGALPMGLRRRVELGRALAMRPKVLLLDEPMAGLNVEEKEDMARFILDVNEERGLPVILIDHDMGVVMDISDRVMVLDYGLKIAEGMPDEVRQNPRVISAYLGVQAEGVRE